MKDFEVIIVDQNDTPLLEPLVATLWRFPVLHIPCKGQRGLSRGRNVGWRRAAGDFILFPDDDCWYDPGFLRRAKALIERTGADVLTGRAANEAGESINGRFEPTAQKATRNTVWTTQIEWVAFFRRSLLQKLGGYDEFVGVGAASPWQACEGQDIVLRALQQDALCWYDPDVFGHHAVIEVGNPDANTIRKGRAYARGMGFVLRKHGFGWFSRIYWVLRPMARAAISSIRMQRAGAKYYANVALGRLEGALGKTLERRPSQA